MSCYYPLRAYCLSSIYTVTFIIILSFLTYLSNDVFAESPIFSRQQITDRYDDLVDMTTSTYFNSSKGKNPLMDLTDILSVNYFSDGKKLNATLWLGSPFTTTNITADILSYGILIDVDFDNTTGLQGADYSVSVNWNRSSNTWYRSFNELESPNDFFNVGDRRNLNPPNDFFNVGDRRNLNSPYSIGRLLDKDHRFITLDFDLSKILFPDKYRIIFFTQYRDRSFWTVDFTDWITIPLPRLVISSFPNPLFLPRGGQATVEVQLNASSGYESDVHLYTDNKIGDISTKFVPENLTVPSYGMATSRLIVRVFDIAEVGQHITLPILAKLTIPGHSVIRINSTNSNKIGTVCGPSSISLCLPSSIRSQGFTEKSSLTIGVMTFEEQLSNFVNNLFNPISTVIATMITIVTGIGAYVFGKSRK
jgi:hypothetical protein